MNARTGPDEPAIDVAHLRQSYGQTVAAASFLALPSGAFPGSCGRREGTGRPRSADRGADTPPPLPMIVES